RYGFWGESNSAEDLLWHMRWMELGSLLRPEQISFLFEKRRLSARVYFGFATLFGPDPCMLDALMQIEVARLPNLEFDVRSSRRLALESQFAAQISAFAATVRDLPRFKAVCNHVGLRATKQQKLAAICGFLQNKDLSLLASFWAENFAEGKPL